MLKILLLILVLTYPCIAMEKIWHHENLDCWQEPKAIAPILNNGGSLDWLPIELVAHITSFILTDNTNGHFYYKCKRIKHLLMTSKRYYTSPHLTNSIVCQIAHSEGPLGPLGACISLHTPATKQWLKNWLQETQNMPSACLALHLQTTLKKIENGFIVLPVSDNNLRNSKKVIRALIEAGVPVDSADGKGRTALMKAFRNGEFELGHFLIKLGANEKACDKKGRGVYRYYHTKAMVGL